MKIAGQKNPGAWFRFNKFLSFQRINSADTVTALGNIIKALDTYPAYVAAVNAIADKTGVAAPGAAIVTAATLAGMWMTNGIPLEVWIGKFTFDTYTKTVNGAGKTVYKADNADAALKFGNDLRAVCAHFKAAKRATQDIIEESASRSINPGGDPNHQEPKPF